MRDPGIRSRRIDDILHVLKNTDSKPYNLVGELIEHVMDEEGGIDYATLGEDLEAMSQMAGYLSSRFYGETIQDVPPDPPEDW